MLSVDPEQFIDDAIESGQAGGLSCLTALQRKIFLVSEAEVCCDKDGIDSFLQKYNQNILECADAFSAFGAMEISSGLKLIAKLWPETNEALLDSVNSLITDRVGYGYESILKCVADNI